MKIIVIFFYKYHRNVEPLFVNVLTLTLIFRCYYQNTNNKTKQHPLTAVTLFKMISLSV